MISITLGIPTYNGESTIKDTLKSIIEQEIDPEFNFDILISNNNSTDDVIDTSINFLKSRNFDRFEIINNERFSNSFDGNILNLYYNFSSNYIWFLSDDDALSSKSSLNTVLLKLKNCYPALVTVNYHECDIKMKINDVRFRKDEIVETSSFNHNEWLVNSRMYFGLISSCIVKRGLVSINEIMPYYNFNSIHIPLLMISATKGLSLSTNNYLIKHRTGNERWGTNGTAIIPMTQIAEILNSFGRKGLYDLDVIRFFKYNFFKSNWRLLLKARLSNSIDKEEILISQIKVYRSFVRFWFLDLIIFFLPKMLLQVIFLYRDKLK